MIWGYDMVEMVTDFIDEPFLPDAAESVIQAFGVGACYPQYALCTAVHLALVFGCQEYVFTADDLSWLSTATEVLLYKISSEISLLFIGMDCSEDEYYSCCAAIVKILNAAFPQKNIYIFKIDKSVAIGSARNFENECPNNFTVSARITKNCVENYIDFLESLYYSDIDEIPYYILQYSPQEGASSFKYDQYLNEQADPILLDESEPLYYDESYENKTHIFSFDADQQEPFVTYKSACKELRGIAEREQVSSYSDLDAATTAEEKAKQVHIEESNENNIIESDYIEDTFSDKAFANAETMLKEMLNKDSDRKEEAHESRS